MGTLEGSRERIEHAIAELSGPDYTASPVGITRHAWIPEYERTLGWFERAFAELGYRTWYDPVGTFVASNRAPGEPCLGIGSHCDALIPQYPPREALEARKKEREGFLGKGAPSSAAKGRGGAKSGRRNGGHGPAPQRR